MFLVSFLLFFLFFFSCSTAGKVKRTGNAPYRSMTATARAVMVSDYENTAMTLKLYRITRDNGLGMIRMDIYAPLAGEVARLVVKDGRAELYDFIFGNLYISETMTLELLGIELVFDDVTIEDVLLAMFMEDPKITGMNVRYSGKSSSGLPESSEIRIGKEYMSLRYTDIKKDVHIPFSVFGPFNELELDTVYINDTEDY